MGTATVKIIMAEFNAKVGGETMGNIGTHGLGSLDERRKDLLNGATHTK